MGSRLLAASCLLCLLAMSARDVIAADNARVLLVSEKTRFKDALIDEMETGLKADGFTVVRALHSKDGFGDHAAGDYDAVFVTNSGVRSEVRPWVVDWLTKNREQASRILLHTTQTKDWTVELDVAVDGVTSASSIGDVKKLAAAYVQRLSALAKQNSQSEAAEAADE